ncbi:MAG: transporter [Thermoanaerobaculia bacterium]
MRFVGLTVVVALLVLAFPLAGQELEPAAYKVVPINANLLQVGYVLAVGDVNFNPALPVEDAEATINTMTVMYGRTLSLFGRSANFGVVAPYSVGHLEGIYIGEFTEVDRSGLRDPLFRLAVNLYGGPAMELKEFASYKPKTNVGASIRILAPLGEYDSSKLINLGTNRWSFKPEIGVTRALGKWSLECYAGVWFFTDNTDFFGGKTREQDPIGSFQGHTLYTFKPGMWLALDLNYYNGGTTKVDGVKNLDLQQNSRAGLTFMLPLNRRSSLRFAYSRGARTTIGAAFDAIAVGYSYVWGGGL